MATLYPIRSICGSSVSYLDAYDLTHHNAVICCDNCNSILMCRQAWGFLYKGGK